MGTIQDLTLKGWFDQLKQDAAQKGGYEKTSVEEQLLQLLQEVLDEKKTFAQARKDLDIIRNQITAKPLPKLKPLQKANGKSENINTIKRQSGE